MELVAARYWHLADDGRIECDLCPRRCRLTDGARGFCFVRQRVGDELVSTTYGRSTGLCVDPIEKKPLHHFLPGTPVLSFGTAGCNLGCRFCQNWSMSRSRQVERSSGGADPEAIARAAVASGSRSVAFTYNDPVVFTEYAIDTAVACHEAGVRTVAVTAGYVTAAAREDLFRHVDAANVDLKAFRSSFYERLCHARLEPVLETLEWLARQSRVWLEVTTLLIEGANDSDEELHDQSRWMVEHLGPDVPLHLSAFHPDHEMTDRPPTSPRALRRARDIARSHGLRYVYTGNVHDRDGDATFCPGCGERVIQRDWYELLDWRVRDGACAACGHPIAGVFEETPGTWGSRRRRITIG